MTTAGVGEGAVGLTMLIVVVVVVNVVVRAVPHTEVVATTDTPLGATVGEL